MASLELPCEAEAGARTSASFARVGSGWPASGRFDDMMKPARASGGAEDQVALI